MVSVFLFEDACEDAFLLGNKGANLVTMTRLGLPVPPGFIISIKAYRKYQRDDKLPLEEIEQALSWLEKKTRKKLSKGLGSLLSTSLNARDDGYRAQPRGLSRGNVINKTGV